MNFDDGFDAKTDDVDLDQFRRFGSLFSFGIFLFYFFSLFYSASSVKNGRQETVWFPLVIQISSQIEQEEEEEEEEEEEDEEEEGEDEEEDEAEYEEEE